MITACQKDEQRATQPDATDAIRIVPQVSPLTPRRVMYSPTESTRLLVVELSGLVELWDVADMAKPELTTTFPASAVEAVFTPDGHTVLTAGTDGRVRSWNLAGTLNWTTVGGHTGPARGVAAQGDLVVSGGEDGAIRFWKLNDGSAVGAAIPAHEGPVMSLAISSQGIVATVGADDAVRLWERTTGSPSWQGRILFQGPHLRPLSTFMTELRLDVHVGFDRSVAFSPKGDLVACAVYDGTVRILALDGTARAVVPEAHRRRNVRGIAFSPKGDLIASAGWDSTARVWNLDGSPHGRAMDAHVDSTFSVSFSADGERLATTGLDDRVRFWSTMGLNAGELPEPRKDRVTAIALAPQAPIVALGTDGGVVRVWNLDGTMRGNPAPGHKGRVQAVAFSPRGDLVASGGVDRTFRTWNSDGSPRATYPPNTDQVAAVAFDPAGDLLVSGSAELRGLKGNRLAFALVAGGWDWYNSIAFASKGGVFVTGTRLGRLQVVGSDGSPRTEALKLPKEDVNGLAFSADGQLIASAVGDDTEVKVWNADLSPHGKPLGGHFGRIRAVAFAPSGGVLASGGDDGVVRLWKLATGEPELVQVGSSINQLGFWNNLLWVRADGETIFFFDRNRKLVATTLLRRDAILTYTPDGWYAGPPQAERVLRGFRMSGERLTDTEMPTRMSPQRVRAALSQ